LVFQASVQPAIIIIKLVRNDIHEISLTIVKSRNFSLNLVKV
jgi:hypothetical protein